MPEILPTKSTYSFRSVSTPVESLCLRRTEQVGLKEKLDVVGNAQRFDEPFDLRVFLLCRAGRTGVDGCEPLLHARQRRSVFRVAEALQLTDERREDVIADDSRSQAP